MKPNLASNLVLPVHAFVELVRAHQSQGMVVAEIGCYWGQTAALWLPIVSQNQGHGLLVDNLRGNSTLDPSHPCSPESFNREGAIACLQELLINHRGSVFIEADSIEASTRVADRSLDICFIDADHRYSQVSRDIDTWKPKVKPGGILCGHDFEQEYWEPQYLEQDTANGIHQGVAKAVMERFPGVHPKDYMWQVVC